MKAVCLLLALVLLGGCTTLNDRMQTWIGQPRDRLISAYGPPDQETKLNDGGASLVYVQQLAGGSGNSGNYSYSSSTCRMIFTADGRGVVTSCSNYGCGPSWATWFVSAPSATH